jgi:hypothetical protein
MGGDNAEKRGSSETTDSTKTEAFAGKLSVEESGKKISRCMFCGEEVILASEEEAVEHMRNCSALQEQLDSKEQFTIPSKLREKMKAGKCDLKMDSES